MEILSQIGREVLTLGAYWLAVYVATVALYFGQGLLMIRINRMFPDRRLQPRRDGMKRARTEIIASLKSLVVTCGYLAGGLYLQTRGVTLWAPLELTWVSAIGMFRRGSLTSPAT